MIFEAQAWKEHDKIVEQRIELKNHLEGYAFDMKDKLVEIKDFPNKEELAQPVKIQLEETLRFLDENELPELEELENKKRALESVVNKFLKAAYGH